MQNKPPIPSPFSEPELEPETLSFKMSVLPIFFGIWTVAAPGLVVLILPSIPRRNWLEPFVLGLVLAAVFAFIIAHTFRVVVSSKSICGHSSWGKPAKLQWDEIASAQKTNWLGLKYLKLSSSTKKNVIWLPLYLSDLPGFVKAVAKFASADNPLRQQLAQFFANNAR